MKNDIIIDFLKNFFYLLNERIISFGKSDKSVIGIVTGFNEDANNLPEHQNFIWHIQNSKQELLDMTILCEYLIKNNLINGDKIIIPENELQKRLVNLGWDISKVQKNINNLLSIEIKMIDDGEETDSFFIHF